jgi:diguanylate cyclase (GGDEF)-like protein/PAS domain S-box-containing protein
MEGSSITDTPEQTSDGVVDYQSFVAASADVSVVSSIDGVYRYVSPACRRLFGWDPADLEGRPEADFVHPDDVTSLHAGRVETAEARFVTTTYRFLCRDGSYRWTEATSRRLKTEGSAVVVSTVRDITERHRITMDLQAQALTDPLTGVANRTVLMDRLHQGLRRLGRAAGMLAVLYLDIDRFKVINDSLGHRIGDTVLLKMAERLTHHVRPADTLARLGGDEFVIVAEGVANEQAATELGNRIIESGRQPFQIGGEEFVCTISVGIAWTNDSRRDAEDLLREADLALYRAKDRGRNRAEVFDEELRTTAVGRLVTERILRRAIDGGMLIVEYQLIIDLRTGHPVGAEALVRISDPEHGLLQPESFLQVAEETGLLTAIDAHVLTDAVKQAGAWHTELADTEFADVAVNITARHLADAGFHKDVIGQLDAHGVPHHNLQIEVTERVLMEASSSAMTGLRALRDAGVQVGLDDFGTGYSSLAYLRQFPLDFVKIDKSFIHDLERDKGQRAIVAAIIGLSHALGLTVVAEGIETQSQLRIFEGLECDRAQGFLFAASAEPGAVYELVVA